MTNYEKIKNMSIEDMAKFMYDVEESPCNHCSDSECDGNCEHRFKEWLMQENME